MVTTTRPKPVGKAHGKQAPQEANTEKVVHSFPANEKASELLGQLSKLMARRSLGVVPTEELADMKLDKADPYIELVAGGKTHRLDVGMAAYGGGLRYVRTPEDGVVYAVEQTVVDTLRLARSQLRELRLIPF